MPALVQRFVHGGGHRFARSPTQRFHHMAARVIAPLFGQRRGRKRPVFFKRLAKLSEMIFIKEYGEVELRVPKLRGPRVQRRAFKLVGGGRVVHGFVGARA